MNTSQPKEPPEIQFLAPESTAIEDFAVLVSRTLAQQLGSAFASPEVINGFSNMLQITAQISSEALTRVVNDEFRSLYEEPQGPSASTANQKTVFKPVRWITLSRKLGMIFSRTSRRGFSPSRREAHDYDLTA